MIAGQLRLATAFLCLTMALPTNAVLPPQHHNARDLAVMVSFVQQHPLVMQSLKSIDLAKFSILFGDNCVVRFGRAAAPARPGPAPPLVYKSSNCPIGAQAVVRP